MPLSGLVFPRDDAQYTFEKSRFPSLSNNTPLGSNGTYTQGWIDSTNTMFIFSGRTDFLQGTAGPQDVNFVSGSVYADQAGTVYVEQSDDQTRVTASYSLAIAAATSTVIPLQLITSRYYRFRYVNGATAQATFVLSQISERIDAFNQVQMVSSSGTSLAVDSNGVLETRLYNTGHSPNINSPFDTTSGVDSLYTTTFNMGFNGTNWDKIRVIPGTTGCLITPYSGMQSLAITAAATTAVKASAGVVGTLTNAGAATSGAITIYDNTAASGKTIWSGTLTAGQVLPLGIPCGTGITIVTAAANTLAVTYA